MIHEQIALWAGFTLFIIAMLALDLGFFQRRPHVISMKEALGWFALWVGLALQERSQQHAPGRGR